MTTKIKSGVIGDNVVGITQLNVSDGTNGQVLTTDGSGTLSFSTISGYTDSDVETYLDGGTSTPTFSTATVTGDLTVDTNTLYVDSTNNRIGIGTTSPAYQVEIENTGSNALLVLNRTDGAACFIEGQATRSAFGSVGATPLALAYNSAAVVEIGANGAITVNPDGANPFTFPTSDGTNGQVLTTDGSGTLSFSTVSSGSFDPDGAVVFNDSSADVDFRIESNGNANMLFVDGGNNYIGVGNATPIHTLHVADITTGASNTNPELAVGVNDSNIKTNAIMQLSLIHI